VFFLFLPSRQEIFFIKFFDVMKKRKQQEVRSLLGAWVCDMANKLMNESEVPMTRQEAFKQAHGKGNS